MMGRGFILAGLVGVGACLLPAATGAQTWASGWGGMLMNPGIVVDPDTGTRWDFGSSFMAGAGVHRSIGQGLLVGLDLGYSPARHEVRDQTGLALLDEGRAHLVTAMLSGRLGAARSGGFATYLAGGIGTMIYGIPYTDGWDPDLALRGGGGVEYAVSPAMGLFLEWYRWWVFHQADGVRDNTVHHGTLEIGARFRL
jgi:opacity protein-like surface antigen